MWIGSFLSSYKNSQVPSTLIKRITFPLILFPLNALPLWLLPLPWERLENEDCSSCSDSSLPTHHLTPWLCHHYCAYIVLPTPNIPVSPQFHYSNPLARFELIRNWGIQNPSSSVTSCMQSFTMVLCEWIFLLLVSHVSLSAGILLWVLFTST